jgi:hypothetical protein
MTKSERSVSVERARYLVRDYFTDLGGDAMDDILRAAIRYEDLNEGLRFITERQLHKMLASTAALFKDSFGITHRKRKSKAS